MNDQPIVQHGPSFLSELSDDVVLEAAILKGPVTGAAKIRQIVGSVGSLFAAQVPGFHAVGKDVEIYEYKATLTEGKTVNGVITITRGPDGLVSHVGSYMTPLDSILKVSAALRDKIPELSNLLFS